VDTITTSTPAPAQPFEAGPYTPTAPVLDDTVPAAAAETVLALYNCNTFQELGAADAEMAPTILGYLDGNNIPSPSSSS
jgi:hypothetical protein